VAYIYSCVLDTAIEIGRIVVQSSIQFAQFGASIQFAGRPTLMNGV